MTAKKKMLLLLIGAGLVAGEARAVQMVKSLYTAIDPEKCVEVPGAGGEARLCEGLEGYPVYIQVREGRTFLAAGPSAKTTRAAEQTLSSQNSILGGGARPTIEWRFVIRGGKTVPYATIVRYFTRAATGAGEVLVVTRVTGEEACHVAYVDALANGDPLVIARRIADEVARKFDCEADPIVHGARGRSPM